MQHKKASWPVDGPRVSRKEFAEELSSRIDTTPEKALKILEESLDLLVDYIHAGARIEFRGAFVIGSKYRRAREAHNPKKLNDKHMIPDSRRVYFKPGKGLSDLPYQLQNLKKVVKKTEPVVSQAETPTVEDGVS